MGSTKAKTLVYSLLPVVLTLLGMAVLRFAHIVPAANSPSMTPSQKLEALEKAAPQSPAMRKFLENEKDAQRANEDAANALPGSDQRQ